jgi:hypothetical protein
VAVVGDAYIVVRALTNRVRQDIQDAVDGIDSIGDNAGKELSDGFNRGFRSGGAGGSGEFFSKKFEKEAEAETVLFRQAFS